MKKLIIDMDDVISDTLNYTIEVLETQCEIQLIRIS